MRLPSNPKAKDSSERKAEHAYGLCTFFLDPLEESIGFYRVLNCNLLDPGNVEVRLAALCCGPVSSLFQRR